MKKIMSIIIVLAIVVIIAIITIAMVNPKTIERKTYKERIDEVLADGKEIERKWLIKKEDIPYDLATETQDKYDIKQTYICFNPEMRVRNYNDGQFYEMTIKNNMSEDGLTRDEINISITKEQYDNLVIKQEGNTIHKTRYQLLDNGQVIALDIFHGDLEGLAYLEIEFANEEESKAFKEPDWVIKDVTDDVNYKNGHLARNGIPEE